MPRDKNGILIDKNGKRVPNQNILKNLRPPWSKENQPKTNGRRKSEYKEYIKENKISYDDIKYLIKYVLPMTKEELKSLMVENQEQKGKQPPPFLVQTFAKALLQDYKDGSVENGMKLIEKTFGK